jgi:hypothetical protein
MKRIMIIVWKEEITLQSEKKVVYPECVSMPFDVEKSPGDKLIYIGKKGNAGNGNLEPKKLKEKTSGLIQEELEKNETSYYLLLLHRGEEICYDETAIKNLIRNRNNIEGCLFGGGNEPIYYSTDYTSGLIDADSSKIFTGALKKGKIIKDNFDHVWNYYTKKKLDDLYHIFSQEAIPCLGILKCIEEKNYENARKYFLQAWKGNTFENILKEIKSKNEVVKKVLKIKLGSIDEDTIGYPMAEEIKKGIKLLKPQNYADLSIDNIERNDFPSLLKKYLNWFGNFSDVLKKYRCQGG